MVDVRAATAQDRERLADTFASAFADDPAFRWIFAGRDQLEGPLRRLFRAILGEDLRPEGHLVYLADDGRSAAVWKGVDEWRMPLPAMLRAGPRLVPVFGRRLGRALRVLGTIEREHPRAPHYYLETLGTRREDQSRGLGSAVVAPMLERCDAEGLPAYLESSNPRNIPFYARHGFEVQGVLGLPAGAPPVTRMWREPRT